MLLENKLKDALSEYAKTKDDKLKNKIVNAVQTADLNKLKEVMYEALVPQTGKADTIAGEMIRAVNRIGYRYFNDGELYFAGHGLETAGSAAMYLSKINKALETLLTRLYPENYLISNKPNESYHNFITTLETRIIGLIQKAPELLLKRNTVDSVRNYNTEAEEIFKTYDELVYSDFDNDLI